MHRKLINVLKWLGNTVEMCLLLTILRLSVRYGPKKTVSKHLNQCIFLDKSTSIVIVHLNNLNILMLLLFIFKNLLAPFLQEHTLSHALACVQVITQTFPGS